MPAEPPRPYHHGDLRRTLIQTALEILNEEQDWEFTLRELARRAGVSHAAPYKHFTDKRELLAEVAALGFERLRAAMDAAAGAAADPAEQLTRIGLAYVGLALETPAHFRLMFGATHQDPAGTTLLPAAAAEAFGVLREVVERCAAQGLVPATEVEAQTLAAWSLVHGLAMLLIDRRIPLADPDTACATAISVLRSYVGLMKRPG